MSKPILIGIDPDVDKSGFAMKKGEAITLKNLRFFELYEELAYFRYKTLKPIIFVECGFLNRSNWHLPCEAGKNIAAAIGNRTGANHEVARKIIEMCEHLGLECHKVKPTASKMNAEAFKNHTGIKGRTNQEQRDAVMLIFGI